MLRVPRSQVNLMRTLPEWNIHLIFSSSSFLFLCSYALQTKDFSPWRVKRPTYLYSFPRIASNSHHLLILKITECYNFTAVGFLFTSWHSSAFHVVYVMLDDRITWNILRLTEKCLPWFALRYHIFMESQKLEIVKVIRAHPVRMLDWHSFLSLWKLLVIW